MRIRQQRESCRICNAYGKVYNAEIRRKGGKFKVRGYPGIFHKTRAWI